MKRKRNILEILIQRRKKYKNRQIPGFKSLATGILNLDEIFQMSGSREIKIFGKADDAKRLLKDTLAKFPDDPLLTKLKDKLVGL